MRALLLFAVIYHLALQGVTGETSAPVIGIVCHETRKPHTCYIAASYVKAVEAAGARVAPIFISRPESYYTSMVKSLNGVLFPGGDASENVTGGYFDAAKFIFSTARKLNHRGDHFPILGVCLGLEFLASLSDRGSRVPTLETCPGMLYTFLPLDFEPGYKNSSLYGGASQKILDILSSQNVTPNYHQYCLRPEKRLNFPWRVLSTNKDGNGKRFVSSMESERGPMAAIQFHPEKNPYEWTKANVRTPDALLASRHFYDWLVGEARKNNHSFPNKALEKSALIYNYCPSPGERDFSQIYYFKK